jgi:hypothetical protein
MNCSLDVVNSWGMMVRHDINLTYLLGPMAKWQPFIDLRWRLGGQEGNVSPRSIVGLVSVLLVGDVADPSGFFEMTMVEFLFACIN